MKFSGEDSFNETWLYYCPDYKTFNGQAQWSSPFIICQYSILLVFVRNFALSNSRGKILLWKGVRYKCLFPLINCAFPRQGSILFCRKLFALQRRFADPVRYHISHHLRRGHVGCRALSATARRMEIRIILRSSGRTFGEFFSLHLKKIEGRGWGRCEHDNWEMIWRGAFSSPAFTPTKVGAFVPAPHYSRLGETGATVLRRNAV